MKPTFYIAGQNVREPENWKALELELNYEAQDNDIPRASITSDSFAWVTGNADIVNAYFRAGYDGTGGLGVYWGLPLQINVGSLSLFTGYLDLVRDAKFSCNKVIAKTREAKTMDWFESIADGRSFDLLKSTGVITSAHYIHIPYINNDIPDYKQAATFFLLSFVITNEIVRCIKDIVDIVADFSGVFNAGGAAIKLIFFVAYLVAQLIALYALIKQMIAELIQPVRYHLGMLFKTHWELMCSSLGLTFSSSIFDDAVPTGNELEPGLWANLCLMPTKTKKGYKRNQSVGEEVGHFDGTFGDWARANEKMFNAKLTIVNGVMHFERRDFGSSSQVYQIPDVFKEVAPKPDFEFYETNAGDIVSNYEIQFQLDNATDLNTLDRYKGTDAKNFITSITSDPNGVELIQGYKKVNQDFALGRRKDVLTRVEQLVKDFLNVFDALLAPLVVAVNSAISAIADVITFVNKIIKAINTLPAVSLNYFPIPTSNFNKPNFSQVIDNRLGTLLLTHEVTSIPKAFLVEGSGWDVKLTTDNETKLSAENLWYKYHYIESFVPSTTKPAGNQLYIYEIPTIPFCIEDYYKIRGISNENRGEAQVISPRGLPARILSLKWNIWKDTAYIKYAEERVFTKNLKEELIVNQGQ